MFKTLGHNLPIGQHFKYGEFRLFKCIGWNNPSVMVFTRCDFEVPLYDCKAV